MTKRIFDPVVSTVERFPNQLVVSCEQPGLMAAPHWHAQVEVNFVFRGFLEYEMCGYRVRLGEGALALFWGGLPHRVVDTAEDTFFHAIHLPLAQFFRLRLAPALQARLMAGATLVAAAAHADDPPAFVRRAAWTGSSEERLAAHAIDELLLRLERMELEPHRVVGGERPEARVVEQGGFRAIHRICRFIAENFREDVGAESVAASADIHPKYAMGVFRRSTGMTLGEYVSLLRVSYAQALLLDEGSSILQVAMESGFGSLSAFNKCFRKQAGMTPSHYRLERRQSSAGRA